MKGMLIRSPSTFTTLRDYFDFLKTHSVDRYLSKVRVRIFTLKIYNVISCSLKVSNTFYKRITCGYSTIRLSIANFLAITIAQANIIYIYSLPRQSVTWRAESPTDFL